MNNETNKLIPELRFPEFVNDGEWNEEKIEEVLTESRIPSIDNNANKRITVRLNLKGVEKRQVRGTESEDATSFFQRKKEQFIYGKQNLHKGAFGLIPDELDGFESSQDIPSFDFNDGFSPRFFVQYLSQEKIYSDLEKISTGTGSKRIHPRDLFKIYFPFPQTFAEQQKIADCLSSLDEVITVHTTKLEALKTYKKGLMQNLFPQGKEKVPKLRFKEFEKDGEWNFEAFSRIYSFLVTNSFSREYLNYENGTVKNIHYGDIHTKFSVLFDLSKEVVPFIKPEVSLEKISNERYCKEGDIVFADASEDLNDVGKSIEIVNLNNEKLLSGLHTLLARQIEPKLIVGFGGYLFQSSNIRNQIKKEAQGAKVLGISGTRLSSIEIYYPENKKEQQKIAHTLSSLDNLIKEQSNKIEQLKSHKKGLMQGLFPKVNN